MLTPSETRAREARAYYNEIDPYAAEWLRNLIAAGLITAGDVDERSIVDVRPSDLDGYERCHFFAGIGVWDFALNLAGWPVGLPIWTGSCPCQPFSAAGGRGGFADERHVWPSWHHLIRECRPPIVAGEQVASKDGLAWLDLVQADLEGSGYACGAIDLCAAGVGAPHIRQRDWFVAHAAGERRHGRELAGASGAAAAGGAEADRRRAAGVREPAGYGAAIELGDAPRLGREGRQSLPGAAARRVDAGAGANGLMADAYGRNASAEGLQRSGQHGLVSQDGGPVPHRWPGAHHGGWDDADWLLCRDGKWRPVEPGTFPLVDGASFRLGSGSPFEGKSRAGMLKGYGNAINAEAAAAFIGAVIDTLSDTPTPGGLAEGERT